MQEALTTRPTAAPASPPGFDFTERDFKRVVELIHRRAGICLAESKRHMVYSRLARRLRQLGLRSFGEYLGLLEDAGAPEWENFTNALTTNLTAFFREAHHFTALAELLRREPRGGAIEIWCAAASTGEEAYSIAMTAVEVFDSWRAPVSIVATDLDTRVLQTAREGIYPLERLDQLDPARRRRFFLRGTGPQQGLVRVRPDLQSMISFRQLNLLDRQWPLRPGFSAVFCRNVMIYFDQPTQREILARIRPLLTPQGLLFAGHSESFMHSVDLFTNLGRTIYRPTPVT